MEVKLTAVADVIPHKAGDIAAPTILLIEDSKFLRIANGRILTKAGYRVVVAVDGEEALHIVHQCVPDAILLDMMLPKMGGPEVLRALKQNPLTAHIPVIVVTGLSQKNEQKLRDDGASAFLEKGQLLDSPEALLHALTKVLGRPAHRTRLV
jgi:CheY-like chemotaxis protein